MKNKLIILIVILWAGILFLAAKYTNVLNVWISNVQNDEVLVYDADKKHFANTKSLNSLGIDTVNTYRTQSKNNPDTCYIIFEEYLNLGTKDYIYFNNRHSNSGGMYKYFGGREIDSSDVIDLSISGVSGSIVGEVFTENNTYGYFYKPKSSSTINIISSVGNVSTNQDAADSLSIYSAGGPAYQLYFQNNIDDSLVVYWKIYVLSN